MRKGQDYQRIKKILKHIIAGFTNPPPKGDLNEEIEEEKVDVGSGEDLGCKACLSRMKVKGWRRVVAS